MFGIKFNLDTVVNIAQHALNEVFAPRHQPDILSGYTSPIAKWEPKTKDDFDREFEQLDLAAQQKRVAFSNFVRCGNIVAAVANSRKEHLQ